MANQRFTATQKQYKTSGKGRQQKMLVNMALSMLELPVIEQILWGGTSVLSSLED